MCQVNGERDDLNMRRADILSKKQELNEINKRLSPFQLRGCPCGSSASPSRCYLLFQIYQVGDFESRFPRHREWCQV
jgi:hypothetical protein